MVINEGSLIVYTLRWPQNMFILMEGWDRDVTHRESFYGAATDGLLPNIASDKGTPLTEN